MYNNFSYPNFHLSDYHLEQRDSDSCAALQPVRTCCVIDIGSMMKCVCYVFDMDIGKVHVTFYAYSKYFLHVKLS